MLTQFPLCMCGQDTSVCYIDNFGETHDVACRPSSMYMYMYGTQTSYIGRAETVNPAMMNIVYCTSDGVGKYYLL